jgi:hypothetical protein
VVAVVAGADDVGATLDEVSVDEDVEEVEDVLLEGVSELLPLPPQPTAKARSAEPPSTAAVVLTWCGMGISLSSWVRQTLPIRWLNTPGARTQTAPPGGPDLATEYGVFVNICGNSSALGSGRLGSADMADADENDPGLACGRRIRLTDGSNSTGEIIEDFGDLAGTEVVIDAFRTAKSRRWAVALDDGRTIFVDDDALELTS